MFRRIGAVSLFTRLEARALVVKLYSDAFYDVMSHVRLLHGMFMASA